MTEFEKGYRETMLYIKGELDRWNASSERYFTDEYITTYVDDMYRRMFANALENVSLIV